MQLSKIGSGIERGIHTISKIFNYAGIAALFGMTAIITINVTGRYVFRSPYSGTFDIVEMLMVVAVFGGLAYCASINGHIRVDLIYGRLSKRTQGILDIITFIPSIFIVVLIAWRLGNRALTILQKPPGPTTLTLEIPYWPLIMIASLGCVLFAVELLVRLVHAIKQATGSGQPTSNHEGSESEL